MSSWKFRNVQHLDPYQSATSPIGIEVEKGDLFQNDDGNIQVIDLHPNDSVGTVIGKHPNLERLGIDPESALRVPVFDINRLWNDVCLGELEYCGKCEIPGWVKNIKDHGIIDRTFCSEFGFVSRVILPI